MMTQNRGFFVVILIVFGMINGGTLTSNNNICDDCWNSRLNRCDTTAKCHINPCISHNKCLTNEVCVANFCGGCSAECIPKTTQKSCKLQCGSVVKHGWKGSDDGSNCCNECTCNNGVLSCSQNACFDCPNHGCRNEPICSENEIYKDCSYCDGTCDDPYPTCNRECIGKCYCKSGFVRDSFDKCVRNNECDTKKWRPERKSIPITSKPKCGKNEEYRECSSCEGTCKTPNKICNTVCQQSKCLCKSGYIRDERTGYCVTENQCVTETPQRRSSTDICSLPKEKGSCRGKIPRYYFNGKMCFQFVYGGCGKNENNFETLNECIDTCEKSTTTTTQTPKRIAETTSSVKTTTFAKTTTTIITTTTKSPTKPIIKVHTCPSGLIYDPCGVGSCQQKCNINPKLDVSHQLHSKLNQNNCDCVPGCYCPKGTIKYQGKCITNSECNQLKRKRQTKLLCKCVNKRNIFFSSSKKCNFRKNKNSCTKNIGCKWFCPIIF